MEHTLATLAASVGAAPTSDMPAPFIGPTVASDVDAEHLNRACWALALLTEVYRGGPTVLALGPLGEYRRSVVTADDLLGLAPASALDQLTQIRNVFETRLLPDLSGRTGPWTLGPTFAGSRLMKADADLIAAGLLIELKTTQGSKRSDGTRRAALEQNDIYQLIGYALLDFDDAYNLREVGIFNARFGYLTTWPLHSLLAELAGRSVDITGTRRDFERLLTTPPTTSLAHR